MGTPRSLRGSPDKAREGRRSGAYSPCDDIKIVNRNKILRHVAGRVGPGSPPAAPAGNALRDWASISGSRCADRLRLRPGMQREMVRPLPDPWVRQDLSADPRTRPEGPPIRGLLAPRRHQDCQLKQILATRCQQSGSRLSAGAPAGNTPGDWASISGSRCADRLRLRAVSAVRDGESPARSLGTPRSLRGSPDKGREGRRSGAYSPCSSIKIINQNKVLRHVAGRVGPGSPLALRPGMRREIGRPSLDLGARTACGSGLECSARWFVPCQIPGHVKISPRIPGQGPKGRRSGAYSPRGGIKIVN